ncbi:MAG: T9SS type A sorting domain-containing protein, partial [Cytophagales bacterium]|nr:T9SS type A sorting domain-containing protein [Cytophaga sp.]
IINIVLPSGAKIKQVNLYTVLGAAVTVAQVAEDHTNLSIAGLSDGLYILVVTSENGTTYRKSIVVGK